MGAERIFIVKVSELSEATVRSLTLNGRRAARLSFPLELPENPVNQDPMPSGCSRTIHWDQSESQHWSHNDFALGSYRAADVNDAA
jgi:hypothetical protein